MIFEESRVTCLVLNFLPLNDITCLQCLSTVKFTTIFKYIIDFNNNTKHFKISSTL